MESLFLTPAAAASLRRRIAEEATSLAQPRIWTDTIGALASTAWRAISAGAPDAPGLLLGAAATAAGLPVAPPSSRRETIARVERLVRRGGPAYIKLGQFIASADGLLPPQWVEAFAWCRDDAPRLEPEVALEIVDRELGEDAFARFDLEPLAAGSIAQVHTAALADGREVIVKVRRPGLRSRLESDISALALAAPILERLDESIASANLSGFVELFAQLTLAEMDFRLEAANLSESRAGYERLGMGFVEVPAPLPGMVTERVLVMERIEGVGYDNAAAVLDSDVDGEQLLELAIGGVLAATLIEGCFHGDLHAGNVLVRSDGSFGLVDFGICGRFDASQRADVSAYLAAFAASDAAGQIDALRRLNAIPDGADLDALVAEIAEEMVLLDARGAGQQITFERLGDAVGRQLRSLSRHGFRMPPELVLFFKNLLYLSSFAAHIAPEADLFESIERAFARSQGVPALV